MTLRERLGLPPARTDNLPQIPEARPSRVLDLAPEPPEWVRRARESRLPAVDRTGPLGR